MIIQIIEGLEYLHSRKIIHRDIKLHNIVVDQNMKCKIIDFGLAKKVRLWNSIDDYSKVLKLNENEGE
jgi:serine/threonine protein kinase